MMLVQTLVVRDEADIVDAQIAYHLNAGIDFVIATDHRSVDGTIEILNSYAHAGVLRLIREEGTFFRQGEWQTRMARLAATEYGADWVISSDADEFWWPRGPSLKEVLEAVPRAYGIVRGLTRNFVPLRHDGGSWAERLTFRLASPTAVNDPSFPFRPVVKVAHRGHPHVVYSGAGSHQVFGLPWPTLFGSYPIEVLHLPLRSREQCARKYVKTLTGWEKNLRGDIARARIDSETGRDDAIWNRVSLEKAALERAVWERTVVTDTRLRDALRGLREEAVPMGKFPLATWSELVDHAVEAAVFAEAEFVRWLRRVDEAEARIARLEARGRSAAMSRP